MNIRFLGPLLANGRTAEVYTWEQRSVLKLLYDGSDHAAIQAEARLARAVQAAGLPVPAVGDLVTVDGQLGLVYERVEGPIMLDCLQSRPWRVLTFARRLAQLQAQLHSVRVVLDLPAQRQRLEGKIRRARASCRCPHRSIGGSGVDG